MKTNGERDLDVLLATMQPELHAATYGFATVEEGFDFGFLHPVMTFRESEGLSLIVEREQATKASLILEFPCRMITLNIHSSLEAVGFLARITAHLAALGMGVNPVSGFYHDHLFVPVDRADDAVEALLELSRQATIKAL